MTARRRLAPSARAWVKRALRHHPQVLQAVRRLRGRVWFLRPKSLPAWADWDPEAAARARAALPVGVNVAGYFESEKGVGEAGRATVRALRAAEVPLVLNNFVDSGSENLESTERRFSGANPHPVNLLHFNADEMPLFIGQWSEDYFRGRINVGFWFWELSEFPEAWQPSFERLDEVWVASTFTQDAVAKVSPIPVVRMPLALSPGPPAGVGRERARFGLPDDAFVFLFAFDFQSLLERKNPLGLLEAFRRAFGDRKDVRLVLKTSHAAGVEAEQLKAAARARNVAVMDTVMARGDLDALFTTADCYVSLHRSEGFALPVAESMSRGIPVIVTAYSGNMDFTTPANSFLVRYGLIGIDRDHGPYGKGNVWADPDLDHAAELMRYVVDNPTAAREVGRRGREHIERFHDPRRVGERMKERLARLLDTKSRRIGASR